MEAQYVHWILWIVLCIAGVAVLEMMGFSIIEKTHAIMKSLSGFSEKTDTPEEREFQKALLKYRTPPLELLKWLPEQEGGLDQRQLLFHLQRWIVPFQTPLPGGTRRAQPLPPSLLQGL